MSELENAASAAAAASSGAASAKFSADSVVSRSAVYSAAAAADDAAGSSTFASSGAAGAAVVWRATSVDAQAPKAWGSLWPDAPQPEGLKKSWEALKAQWVADGPHWSFWIDWYEAVRDGRWTNWDLIFRMARDISEGDWEAGQAAVGARIEQIRAAHDVAQLADEVAQGAYLAQSAAPGIGHNNPPKLIDEDLPEHPLETIIWVAADELRIQASAPIPDMGKVRKAVGVLVGILISAGKWTGQKVDKAVDAAASAFGAAGGAAALAYLTGHGDKIASLLDAALRWLNLVS